VLLARHGRTVLNAQGRLRGRLDPPLDEVGVEEAARLGEALARYAPRRVISSPLRRARETARAVAERAGGSVEVDDRLADRDYGPAAGLTLAEVQARWGSLAAVPGIEPVEQLTARALAVLADLHAGPASAWTDPVVLVAHDVVNRAVLAVLPPHPGRDEPVDQRTGCWNVLGATVDSWRVLEVDVVAP
jgi:probable phosphoglycerate mutase